MSKKKVEDAIVKHWHTAPVDIEAIIKSSGIELDTAAELDDNISGELRKTENGYKISVNPSEHQYRQRFTMAHELAHFYLHASLIKDGVDDNKIYNSARGGNFYNQSIEKKHEYEANSFAIFMLMPEHLINAWVEENSEDVPLSIEAIERLADYLNVSSQALKIRLKMIGIAVRSD